MNIAFGGKSRLSLHLAKFSARVKLLQAYGKKRAFVQWKWHSGFWIFGINPGGQH
jgi:hypothetical protein